MKFSLTLTMEQVQLIANALAEQPFKISAPLISQIQKQVSEQSRPQAVEAEPMLDAAE